MDHLCFILVFHVILIMNALEEILNSVFGPSLLANSKCVAFYNILILFGRVFFSPQSVFHFFFACKLLQTLFFIVWFYFSEMVK